MEHNSHIHKGRKLNAKEIYEYEEVMLSIVKELKSVFSLISDDETRIAGKATQARLKFMGINTALTNHSKLEVSRGQTKTYLLYEGGW